MTRVYVLDPNRVLEDVTENEKPEASDDIALWLADEFSQVS